MMSSHPVLQSPVKLLDQMTLETKQQHGHTPRPSKAQLAFLSGMQALDNKSWKLAAEKLTLALQEAEKAKASNMEEFAVALSALGYFFACRNELEKTEILYTECLNAWRQLHGANSPRLAPVIIELSTILELQKNESKRDQAEVLVEGIYKSVMSLGASNPVESALLAGKLASIKAQRGKLDEARNLYRHACEVCQNNKANEELVALSNKLKQLEPALK